MKKGFITINGGEAMFYTLIAGLMLTLVFGSPLSMAGVRSALLLCYQTVIPSLFPFFVLSGLLTGSGFPQRLGAWLSPLMNNLFHLSGEGAIPFLIGIISGYPMGAAATAELYREKALTKEESERLLAFCNNAGPLFIIGAVGSGLLGRTDIGIYLYIIHILSAVIVGIVLRPKPRKEKKRIAPPLPVIHYFSLFSDSVSKAVTNILSVCGYITLFSAFTSVFSPQAEKFLPHGAVLLLQGLTEVTNGCKMAVSASLPPRLLLPLLSAFLGCGGLCVFLQAVAMTKKTDLAFGKYLKGKILQSVTAACLCYLSFPVFFKESQAVFLSLSAHAPGLSVKSGFFCLLIFLIPGFLLIQRKGKSF